MKAVAILTVLLAVAASAAPSQHEPAVSSAVSGQTSSVVQGPSVQANVPSVDSVQPVSQQHPSSASYYAPAGLVTVVGEQGSKPVQVRNFGEQYGQPEPASLPANYKPFGSWGLYIGGNPADGYYSNYYKALSSSVEKQQQSGEPVKPTGSQTVAFSPLLKQSGPSGDYYPFAYSPSELSTGAPVPMASMSPVQAGVSAGYGAPSYFDNGYAQVSAYADSYATKKMGSQFQQKEASKEPSKGQQYQSPRVYVYPAMMAAPAPMSQPQQSHVGQQQVVSYAVPVGSQIVGSQPGLEGAFNPYGVHAFTRYAVKPMVSQEPGYYYGGSSQSVPYKQQQAYSSHAVEVPSYPMGFYGYPMSQLHYSQASMSAAGHGEPHHGLVSQVEPISDKSEVEDKVKPQKRA